MKRTFLKFDGQGRPLFGMSRIKRNRLRHAAFKTGENPDDDNHEEEDDEFDSPEAKLMKGIQKRWKAELQKRGFVNQKAVDEKITETLKDVPLDGLRAYTKDKETIDAALLKIGGELEKMKQNSANPFAVTGQKRNWLREGIEKLFSKNDKGEDSKVELAFRNRDDQKTEIKFNVRAAAVMTTTNTIDETTFTVPVELLESFSIAEFVGKRYGQQYIYEIADRTIVTEIEQYKTWLEEGDEQGAFAIVAEGGLKPLVSTGLVRNFAKAKKVAGKYVVTEEFAKFRKNAYAIIRRLIMDKLVRDYSAILTTDLNAQAAGYTGSIMDGTVIAPNDYDAIGAVAAQMEALNFFPDVLIINPQDKWRIRLTKDDEGRYLFPMVTENGVTTMMGLRIVTSTYQTVGTFTLGEAGMFKIEEEPVTVRMGYGVTVTGGTSNGGGNVTDVQSDLDHNRFRVIVETYFLNYIATPNIGSFVRTTFATVKTALLLP